MQQSRAANPDTHPGEPHGKSAIHAGSLIGEGESNLQLDGHRLNGSVGQAHPSTAPSVAIVSINFEPELTGIAVYSTGMAEYLASQGHSVTVHTGFPYYPAWSKQAEHEGKLFTVESHGKILLRRCYLYVPRRPSALRRMVHELSFTVSASLSYLFSRRRDVTIIVSPPLLLGLPIGLLAKMKGSKTVFHVQDLQPDAAVDLGMLKPGLLTRLLFGLERTIYRIVDRVSTISDAMRAKIHSKGVAPEKTFLIRNWADDHLVAQLAREQSLRREWDLEQHFVILYSGNMGIKQGLESLLELAAVLLNQPEIRILIVGDGGQKEQLVASARNNGLTNVIFKPPVPRDQLARLLATADVSIIPQKASVQDLVLPSKLGNILCSGRPVIVAADPQSELGQLVLSHDSAIVVSPEDHVAMAEAVVHLWKNSAARERLGRNGTRLARSIFARTAILDSLVQQLRVMVGDSSAAPDEATSSFHNTAEHAHTGNQG